MSSPFRAEALLLVCLLALAGCQREIRDYKSDALKAADRGAAFEGNSFHIAQGQRLFGWMNCAGCHGHGGGGMGPPLMDDEWRYGGSMAEIAATILEGRPNGMPSFRGRITEDQAWQLAAFVRSLSAQPRQDALPLRADEPRNIEPMTLDERKPIRRVSPKQDDSSEE
jgi:cytochrome c oxidase cbb3-type subunit III